MPQCCFAGCHNRTDDGRGLSFFRFPRKDAARTASWIKACGRKEFVPSQHSRVCSQHFKQDDFERDIRSEFMVVGHKRLRLKETAVPCPSFVTSQQDIIQTESNKMEYNAKASSTNNKTESGVKRGNSSSFYSTKQDDLEESCPEIMEPPIKRQCLDDVLDLSRKSNQIDNEGGKAPCKNDDDVIMLSEDEDDSLLGALCDEMEKENTPKPSLLSKSRALILKLENELRNEESALMLLQQLRTNQRSHALQPKGTKTPSATPTARNTQSPVNHANNTNPVRSVPPTTSAARVTQSPALNSNVPNSQNTSTIPKVTKSMAIHALEQQCNGKKAMLRKQLERTLDKVALPKPAVGNGLCVVPFVPSTLTNEFTALIGLEEIVNTIQDFDPLNTEKSSDQSRFISPFSCSRCGTDFTPVWKRKRPGSSEVVCEACIIDGQRSAIHKAYNNVISAALKQHAAQEREIENEYQDIVNSPAKLEAFIKEHERKLMVTQQAQMAQQQQQQLQQAASANNLHNQRYHQQQQQQQQGFQTQNMFNTASSSRHGQTTPVNSAAPTPLGMSNMSSRRQSASSSTSVNSPVALPIQQQGHSAGNVVQQLASRYQQLTKAAVAAVVGGGQNPVNHSIANNAATANLMMAAAANPMLAAAAVSATSQQQQSVAQQQLTAAALAQQRLAAVAALNFQHQQQPHHAQPSAGTVPSNSQTDHLAQFTQMQTLLMSSLLGNAGMYYKKVLRYCISITMSYRSWYEVYLFLSIYHILECSAR
uniref:THAP-type domain-containing protein n=1 Tax=Trichobilharzia regenti TaxID=157069 RepID=A0AA85KC38_TRIRE|nr:unnamed protein product [Trichobilharzia regenti]